MQVAQLPQWFVSHWWGERIRDFLLVLERHAEVRLLGEMHAEERAHRFLVEGGFEGEGDDCYWVCAYANRQWELSKAVSENPEESSFYQAMRIAQQKKGGVLLVLDDVVHDDDGKIVSGPATAFTRVWCAFEESKAVDVSNC